MPPEDKFFNIKFYKPQINQILVTFTSLADFIEGDLKESVIDMLLTNPKGAEAVVKVLKNNAYAIDESAIVLAKVIAEDLLTKSKEETLTIPHEYILQINYWVDKDYWENSEYAKNPHYSTIKIINDFSQENS